MIQRPSKLWQGGSLAELQAIGTADGVAALDFGVIETGAPGLYQATTAGASSSTWTATGGGGGGAVWTVATETTATRSAVDGEFVLVNVAACVITLPAPAAGSRVAVKAITSTITGIEVRTSGGGITIDGTDYSATGLPLAEQFEMITAISDGSNWWIY